MQCHNRRATKKAEPLVANGTRTGILCSKPHGVADVHRTYAFEAEEEGELTVQKGDTVTVDAGADGVFGTEDDTRDGWVLVQNKRNMQSGYVPVDYLQINEAPGLRLRARPRRLPHPRPRRRRSPPAPP